MDHLAADYVAIEIDKRRLQLVSGVQLAYTSAYKLSFASFEGNFADFLLPMIYVRVV